jgi:hypothetical protein
MSVTELHRAYFILLMKAWEYYKKLQRELSTEKEPFSYYKGYEYEHYSQS